MSYEDYEKGVDLLIERYTAKEKYLAKMIDSGKYTGGQKIGAKVMRELEGQRHEVGHFVHDLEQLKVDGNQ